MKRGGNMFDKVKNKLIKKLGGYTFQEILLKSQQENIVSKSYYKPITIHASMNYPTEYVNNKDNLIFCIEKVIRGSISDYILENKLYNFKVNEHESFKDTSTVSVRIKVLINENGDEYNG